MVLLGVLALPPRLAAQHVHACFAPERPGAPTCTARIVSAVASAHRSILVQAYGFTSAPIAKALADAHARGVDVHVILDKSNIKDGYSSATFLQHVGIIALIDSNHSIAHNKVMVIDAREVITGSFNFTKAAEEKNAENVVFIEDPAAATAYAQNWKDHAAHSVAVDRIEQRTATGRDDDETPLGVVGKVTGNRRTHIYHRPGCPGFEMIAAKNRVEFANAQTAEAAGYRPAHNCP